MDTKAILTLNSQVITQNSRYALLTQVQMLINDFAKLALLPVEKSTREAQKMQKLGAV